MNIDFNIYIYELEKNSRMIVSLQKELIINYNNT